MPSLLKMVDPCNEQQPMSHTSPGEVAATPWAQRGPRSDI